MISMETDEKRNWLLNVIEDGDIIIDSRHMTKEDREAMCREIAEYKAQREKNKVKEAVLA